MFGLSFLYPAFLIGVASIAIPVVLHLLTQQAAPRVPFSAVRFLKRVPIEDSRRRLRELLLLALRVAALLLLAFAFARPFTLTAASSESDRITVVAVDTSFSMAAPGQFERAQALARDAVNAARADDRVGVVAFSDAADVIARPTDRGEALAAIDRLRPAFGATRYAPALTASAELVGGRSGRIVLVTDLQKSGWDIAPDATIPSRLTVEIADVGAPDGNLGVTDIRPAPDGLLALVRNAGSHAVNGRVHLTVDGRPAGESTLTADAGALSEVHFSTVLPREGVVAVTVDDARGYPADNRRYLVLDPPAAAPILAVTTLGNVSSEAFYLQRALMVNEQAFQFTAIGIAGLMQMSPERLTDHAAILLLGSRGIDRRGRDTLQGYVQRGGALLLVAGPDMDPDAPARIFPDIELRARMRETASVVSFAPADARHPIFRPFGPLAGNLGRVRFERAVQIDDAPGAKILARFSDGTPALLEYQRGTGRLLYFTSDLNRQWNDFPLHPTFVLFVQGVMRYLAAWREAPREYLVADAPVGLPREPGVVSVPSSGRAGGDAPASTATRTRRVAINVDTRESDPTRIGTDALLASIGRLGNGSVVDAGDQRQGQEDKQRLWRYGLALMLVSLVLESALGRRM